MPSSSYSRAWVLGALSPSLCDLALFVAQAGHPSFAAPKNGFARADVLDGFSLRLNVVIGEEFIEADCFSTLHEADTVIRHIAPQFEKLARLTDAEVLNVNIDQNLFVPGHYLKMSCGGY